MNYRHAFHAGNFADVLKHAVMARLIEYLKRKDKAFRVIDTHAGAGLYDLSAEAAARTGEWRRGVGLLEEHALAPQAAALLAPYLAAVEAARAGHPDRYPGSPLIARHLLRRQDRLTAIERHPEEAASLARLFAGDIQTRVIAFDGWLALRAHLPPKEKRGLVLVDPPFEEEGEFQRMVEGLEKAWRRWPGGIYVLWYPIKDRRAVNGFRTALLETGIPKIADIRLEIRGPSPEPRLDGCGVIVVNPPFVLEAEMRTLLPALARILGEGPEASWRMTSITGEAAKDQP